MSAPIASSTWSGRRHHRLSRRELELLAEMAAVGEAEAHHPVLDTPPAHSPAMRRFLGY